MKCPDCSEETRGRFDNRGKVRCDFCWAILPLLEPEAPKPKPEPKKAKAPAKKK